MSGGLKEIQQYQDLGFDDNQITEWMRAESVKYMDMGFSQEQIEEHFGLNPFDEAPLRNFFRTNLQEYVQAQEPAKETPKEPSASPNESATPAPPEPPPSAQEADQEKVDTFWEAMQAGWQSSSLGLALRRKLPDLHLEEKADLTEKIGMGLGMLAGDLPASIAGAILATPPAAAAAAPTLGLGTIATISAGASMAPAAIRAFYIQKYSKGEIKDFDDFWARASTIFFDTAKETAAGVAGGVVGGKVLSRFAGTSVAFRNTAAGLSEVATNVATGAALEGELPDVTDFAAAATVLLGVSAASKVTSRMRGTPKDRSALFNRIESKLHRIFVETGYSPEQVLEAANSDLSLKQQLLSSSMELPEYFKDLVSEDAKALARKFIQDERGEFQFGSKEEILGKPKAELTPEQKRVAGQIASEEPKTKLSYDEFYRSFVDRLDPIRRMVEDMAKGPVEKALDPYIWARLLGGNGGRGWFTIDKSTYDFNTLKNNGRGLRAVLKPIEGDIQAFEIYAVAKRNVEKEGQGFKTGGDVEASRIVVEQGKAKYEPVLRELVDFQDRIIDNLVKSGIISEEKSANLKAKNRDYVPFYRITEEAEAAGGKGTKVKDPTKAFRGMKEPERIKGETDEAFAARKKKASQIVSPLETIVRNTLLYVNLAEQNRVGRALVDLAAKHDPNGVFVRKQKASKRKIDVTDAELAAWAKENDVDISMAEDAMKIFRPVTKTLAPDEIAVFIDGKREIFQVGEEVATAMKASDEQAVGALIRALSIPARVLQTGATLTPDFIIRNITWDQLAAFLQTKGVGNIPLYHTWKGAMSLFQQDSNFENWIKGGGANIIKEATTLNDIQRNYVDLDKKVPFLSKVRNVVSTPLDLLKFMAEASEHSTRLGEFIRVTGGGGDLNINQIVEGAYASREVTLDFARRGARTKVANMLIPFFNAGIQGTDKTVRVFKDNPKSATAKASALAAASLLLYLANREDEVYVNEVAAWEKNLFWHFPFRKWEPATIQEAQNVAPWKARRTKNGGWEVDNGFVFRLPKPQGAGMIISSGMERLAGLFLDDQKKEAGEFLLQAANDLIAPNYMPMFALAPLEHLTNHSFFRGTNLIPGHLEDLVPELHVTPYTSTVAKIVGRAVGGLAHVVGKGDTTLASPIIIDNYINNWTGGLGRYVLEAVDDSLRKAGIGPVTPAKKWTEYPGVKAFFSRNPTQSADAIVSFEKEYAAQKKIADSLRYAERRQDYEMYDRLEAKYGEGLDRLDGIHQTLSDHRRLISDLHRLAEEKEITPDELRQEIDAITMDMIVVAAEGNEELKEMKKALKEEGL